MGLFDEPTGYEVDDLVRVTKDTERNNSNLFGLIGKVSEVIDDEENKDLKKVVVSFFYIEGHGADMSTALSSDELEVLDRPYKPDAKTKSKSDFHDKLHKAARNLTAALNGLDDEIIEEAQIVVSPIVTEVDGVKVTSHSVTWSIKAKA